MVANGRSVTSLMSNCQQHSPLSHSLGQRTWSQIKRRFLLQRRNEKSQSLRCAECVAHVALCNRILLCWLASRSGGNWKVFVITDTAVTLVQITYRLYAVLETTRRGCYCSKRSLKAQKTSIYIYEKVYLQELKSYLFKRAQEDLGSHAARDLDSTSSAQEIHPFMNFTESYRGGVAWSLGP